jgi:D-serine deaminase-like pyridoxal phosphate-dependent protein
MMRKKMTDLGTLDTPCLLLDEPRLERNLARMRARVEQTGVSLRPHMKTAKSVEVGKRVFGDTPGPITVSTLREAEKFAAAGYRDILYAVGISAPKLPRAAAIAKQGVTLSVIVDTVEGARAIADFARTEGVVFPTLIELDTDGHRAGVRPGDAVLIEIGRILSDAGALAGVMSHSGGTYDQRSDEAIASVAEAERSGLVAAAEALRAAGMRVDIVSGGSTPSVVRASDLQGLTEVRAGVYMFQDLVMAGLGVCSVDDIAPSVLTTVIGHQRERNWIIVDAGWTALSRDRGTASHAVDQGFGLVCDLAGAPLGDLIVKATNQEHGTITSRDGSPVDFDQFPIGRRLRILPNHACATCGQHEAYHVVDATGEVVAVWPRFSGW